MFHGIWVVFTATHNSQKEKKLGLTSQKFFRPSMINLFFSRAILTKYYSLRKNSLLKPRPLKAPRVSSPSLIFLILKILNIEELSLHGQESEILFWFMKNLIDLWQIVVGLIYSPTAIVRVSPFRDLTMVRLLHILNQDSPLPQKPSSLKAIFSITPNSPMLLPHFGRALPPPHLSHSPPLLTT